MRLVPVGDGTSLRVLDWRPRQDCDTWPLVFVAGWVSVVAGWAPLLRVLVPRRPVLYIETREKRSATFARRRLRPEDFTIPRLADDLIAALKALDLEALHRAASQEMEGGYAKGSKEPSQPPDSARPI